jgi:hypothetical protein
MWALSSAGEQDQHMLKDHLASWRHSAHTATIERPSKVKDGRIHDAGRGQKNGDFDALENMDIAAIAGTCRGSSERRVSRAEALLIASAADRPLPSFDPRANLNNRHSSHCRRKMVRIARQ